MSVRAAPTTVTPRDGLPRTRSALREDLRRLGCLPGDAVMVHAAVSRVGPLLDGPDTLVGALLDAVTPGGTILAYTDWQTSYHQFLDESGRVPAAWRAHVAPFDPASSRAIRENGVFPEFLRTWPGATRSANPGASVAAIGAGAEYFTSGHPLDYGYGRGSPLATLVEASGSVLMVGAPLDTMPELHHAEHLADVPDKRVVRHEVPIAVDGETRWRMVEEFDTADPVVADLPDDYFATIVEEFLTSGAGVRGLVGKAPAVMVPAREMCAFAVRWLERRPRRP